jgi:hypothetical protein
MIEAQFGQRSRRQPCRAPKPSDASRWMTFRSGRDIASRSPRTHARRKADADGTATPKLDTLSAFDIGDLV